jgi:hypothetical protein
VRRLPILIVAIAASACVRGATGPTPSDSGATQPPVQTLAQHTPLNITLSTYGSVKVATSAGATCTLSIRVNAGQFGDGPPATLSGVADDTGFLAWTYPTPLVPTGRSSHFVECSDGHGSATASADFDVPLKALDARGFTVRTQPVDVTGLSGVQTQLDPSLVPARDAVLARLGAALPHEWTLATRGLGSLSLVASSADITIYVLPGRGTSVHGTAFDGTQRVLIYVVDETGAISPENAVAVALHELGHIWCCFGPDAGPDGHWLAKIPDPLLQGVDQYGLMTHPVTCLVKPGLESCPNRFSERELRTMGFTEIPAPPPDTCVAQATSLTSQIATIDGRLAASRSAIDAAKAQLASLESQIKAIEAKYPGLVLPPDVYATYNSLVSQYNTLVAQNKTRVDAYNQDIDARNALAQQRNALPC